MTHEFDKDFWELTGREGQKTLHDVVVRATRRR